MTLGSFLRGAAVAAALATLLPSAGQAADIHTLGSVAGWDIIVDKTLGFGCAMQAEFEGGALVRMGINKQNQHGYIMVFRDDWSDIRQGQVYPLLMDIDGQGYDGQGEGVILGGAHGVYIPFDSEDMFLDLMKRYVLRLSHQGRMVAAISLRGTNDALQATLACQDGVDSAR